MATAYKNLKSLRAPIVKDRLRCIGHDGFTYLNHRFLRDRFLASLERDELALYVFLVLGANRDGVSFYRYDAICSILTLTLDDFIAARNALIDKDLIAFDGTRFQVLSLPEAPIQSTQTPIATQQELNAKDPATIRAAILASLGDND